MVDTHCHLDVCEPPDAELVRRAREAGVVRIATIGTDVGSNEAALRLAGEHEDVHAAIGCHPQSASDYDPGELEALARGPGVCAIGETGLDYYRDRSPREDQRKAFLGQIELARLLGLSLIIHTRAAEEDTFAILREHAQGLTVVMHCFSAPDRLDECVERGYMCSFAGNVTYPKATGLQAAAREVPDELLLVETDAPFLAPQPVRGKPNEPANVRMTAQAVAALRGVSYDELEQTVERNAERVFGW